MSEMTREEAITKLVAYSFWASEHVPDEVAQALDIAIEALKEQRQHGEWVCKGAVGNGTWCSVCDTNIKLFPNKYSFCPNCGASMRKRGEVEEGDEK